MKRKLTYKHWLLLNTIELINIIANIGVFGGIGIYIVWAYNGVQLSNIAGWFHTVVLFSSLIAMFMPDKKDMIILFYD